MADNPYTLVIIKPLSIGRGQGPVILEDLLRDCPVVLTKFRPWKICDTTWKALGHNPNGVCSPLRRVSWCCVFSHVDGITHPTSLLEDYCGPVEKDKWTNSHLRYKYSSFKQLGNTVNSIDDVVHISPLGREELEVDLVF